MTSSPCIGLSGGNSAGLFSPKPLQTDVQGLHGLVSCAEWTGVKLSTLLDETGIDPKAKWFIAEGADAAHVMRSTPLSKALDDAMIVLYQNGEPLMPGNGYPMRLLLPGYEGNMNTINMCAGSNLLPEPAMVYWESQVYTEPREQERAYQFYFVNEVKSFITRRRLPDCDLHECRLCRNSRIAYSGKGRISKVLVSGCWRRSRGAAATRAEHGVHALSDAVAVERRSGHVAKPRLGRGRQRAADARGNSLRRVANCSSVPPLLAFENHHFNAVTTWAVDQKGDRSLMRMHRILLVGCGLVPSLSRRQHVRWAQNVNLGKPISAADLAAWDIDVEPDGAGLPPGHGTSVQGASIFADNCAACHGDGGKGAQTTSSGAPAAPPVVSDTKRNGIDDTTLTIANYWPYATTLFDYIRRSMPWTSPRTLADGSFATRSPPSAILAQNKLIDSKEVINAQALLKVQMPNRNGFIPRFPERMPHD